MDDKKQKGERQRVTKQGEGGTEPVTACSPFLPPCHVLREQTSGLPFSSLVAPTKRRERETGPGERRPLCVVAGDWKEIIGDCETVKIMERGGQARMADPLSSKSAKSAIKGADSRSGEERGSSCEYHRNPTARKKAGKTETQWEIEI